MARDASEAVPNRELGRRISAQALHWIGTRLLAHRHLTLDRFTMSESDSPHSRSSRAASADMSEAEQLERRLAFLEMSAADGERLRKLSTDFEAYAAEFAEAFYRHLFRFEETARFLQDPERLERLKRVQQEHFRSLLQACWDQDYVEQRRRVGFTHAEVGLEPLLFLGAYNQYVQHCLRRFCDGEDETQAGKMEAMSSLMKAIFFDIGLTLDAYFQESTRDLRQALEMYWKANSELRQFAQLTSHDLKTPLATVANLCDEAVDEFAGQMPDEARDLIERARRGIFRMSNLVDELLGSAIAPESTESHEMVASRQIIDEAVERVRPLLESKQIALSIQDDLPKIWGNRVRLREAFYNLISNAAKYIDSPRGRIDVLVEQDETHCVFTIVDNGPGIPASELGRVFSPFRRLRAHRAEPGTGLGLYFTKNLIEEQGGHVWVESEVSVGSRFFVRLPTRPRASESSPGEPI